MCSGHAKGLKSLNGEHLEFCDDSFRQIYNDPEVLQHNTICVKIFAGHKIRKFCCNFTELNPQKEAAASDLPSAKYKACKNSHLYGTLVHINNYP